VNCEYLSKPVFLHFTEAVISSSINFKKKVPYLTELEDEIPKLMSESRATSTAAQYDSSYRRWLSWLKDNKEKNCMPANPKIIVLYLLHLSKTGVSMAVINLAFAAISWKHTIIGLKSPGDNTYIKEALSGLRRRLARPRAPKEPFSLAHLH